MCALSVLFLFNALKMNKEKKFYKLNTNEKN